MVGSLRDELVAFSRGWRNDLSAEWQTALADVNPSAAAVSEILSFSALQPIFPGRRHAPLRVAREDAHVFRALDDLAPGSVRCVLLGQDPYPRADRATGRAFEQGEAEDWSSLKASPSLAGLVRHLAEYRTRNPTFRGAGGFRRAVASEKVRLESPRDLFDRWQNAGVLCLNTGLTLTRYRKGGAPEQKNGHLPFWTPVVRGILNHLSRREGGKLVLLLMGRAAWNAADGLEYREAVANGRRPTMSVEEVKVYHPSYTRAGPNPFTLANDALARMGEERIHW